MLFEKGKTSSRIDFTGGMVARGHADDPDYRWSRDYQEPSHQRNPWRWLLEPDIARFSTW